MSAVMDRPTCLLVTGGAGFIGSNFVRHALAAGIRKVVTLDALTYAGNRGNLEDLPADRHVLVQGDICDRALIDALLAEHRPAGIVHLAAESHVDRSIDGPAAFVQTNVVGTFTLLDAARVWSKFQPLRFHHVSTDEVFGSLGPTGAFTEESRYEPSSPYSATKAGSDHLVRAYGATYGLDVVVTNCSNNYGPRQFPEKLVPLMILNCLAGKPLPVYGDGLNVRDWLYVEDHCEALLAVFERGRSGQTYNVGGGTELTNLELVHTLTDLMDELHPAPKSHRELVTFVTDRPGHDRRYAIDCSKIEHELGVRARHSLAAGLRETVRWYLDNGTWCERIASGSYRGERLGLSPTPGR
jgi:dTDP-glucose 4,6-dehydratase